MKDFVKAKKRYQLTSIIMGILTVIAFIAGFAAEILGELDNLIAIILFAVAFVLLILCIPFIFLFYRMNEKYSKQICERLNKRVGCEYSYTNGGPITDLVLKSMYPYPNIRASALEGILGMYDSFEFEYYLFNFLEDSLTSRNKTLKLYILKNISVYEKNFFITNKKIKNAEEYKVIPMDNNFKFYTKTNEEIENLDVLKDIPQDVIFISVMERTAYIYKIAEQKKPLFSISKTEEEFEQHFAEEISKIEQTFEEAKHWIL